MNADEQTKESLEEALNLEGGDGQWCIAAIEFIGRLRMQGVKAEQVNYPSFIKRVFEPPTAPNSANRTAAANRTITSEQDPHHKEKLRDYTLWFGKYAHQQVRNIDADYLRWLLKQEGNGNMHPACRNELRIRGTWEEQGKYKNPYRPL